MSQPTTSQLYADALAQNSSSCAPPFDPCAYQPAQVSLTRPGDSAYQIAVKNGFMGTEADWLASLQGGAGQLEIGEPIPNFFLPLQNLLTN